MIATLMAVAILFVGCKKEKAENKAYEPQATPIEGMLHFNSAEELSETLLKIQEMSETERREWERRQGFKSYATKCYELLEDFEAKGINSEEDVYNFVKENSEYFYIHEENGEKSVKCCLIVSPYFYLVNEERLLQTGNQCMKAFEEGVAHCSIKYLDEIIQIRSFSERSFSDYISFVQLKSISQSTNSIITNPSKGDVIKPLGNSSEYMGLRASRTSWREGNRNTIELIEEEIYIPPVDENMFAQYITNLFIFNYPEHRIAGLWFPCQRRKSFAVTVKWSTRINYTINTRSKSFTVIDEGGYTTRRTLEAIMSPINAYSFKHFYGSAYTYDTPAMMNFDSNQPNFY